MHAYRWRREGVVGREHQGAPVLPIVVGGGGRAGEDIMPPIRRVVSVWVIVPRRVRGGNYSLQDVRVGGVGDDEWGRILLYGFVLAGQLSSSSVYTFVVSWIEG